MARTCFLHVGMHKTGSSAIQHTLFHAGNRNPVYLRGDDIRVPKEHHVRRIGANHSAVVYSLFSSNRYTFHGHRKQGLSPLQIDDINHAYRKYLKAFFQATTPCDVLISAESVMRLDENEIKALLEYLLPYFDRVVVIAYARTPWSYMSSNTQQSIKGGACSFNLDLVYPSYQRKLEPFVSLLPPEQLLLRKFDAGSFTDGCVVRDFCQQLGIELDSDRVVRNNESLSTEALSLLFAYRKTYPYGSGTNVARVNNRLCEKLQAIGSTRFRLSADVVGPILQENIDDITWMERQLGTSLQEDLGMKLPTDISSEGDLLDVAIGSYDLLGEFLATERIQVDHPESPTLKHVANAVQRLRQRIESEFNIQQSPLVA